MRFFAALILCLCVLAPGALFGQGRGFLEGFGGVTSLNPIGSINSVSAGAAFGFWGGYAFSNNFAVEAGYGNFGKFDVNYSGTTDPLLTSQSISSFNIGLKGVYPLRSDFFLTGRVGMAMWDNKADVLSGTGLGSTASDGEDPYFGFGISYKKKGSEFYYYTFEYLTGDFGDTDVDVFCFGVGTVF